MPITQGKLKKLFHYNPHNGTLVRKTQASTNTKIGDVAGSMYSDGYITVRVEGEKYRAHRLVWLWHYGYFPEHHVDHINRIRNDNRIENLREVSSSCNLRNTGNYKNNTSGVKGVSWSTKKKKWVVNIRANTRTIKIGAYHDFLEAVCHRLAAEQAEGWPDCDSCSPAYQYVNNHIDKRIGGRCVPGAVEVYRLDTL